MAHKQQEVSPFMDSDIGTNPDAASEHSVFVLVVYRDGNLTAAVHRTEGGAKEAAADLLDDDEEVSTLEVRFARAQRLISDEGGVMEIVHSPVFDG